jgi:hypothetical protein
VSDSCYATCEVDRAASRKSTWAGGSQEKGEREEDGNLSCETDRRFRATQRLSKSTEGRPLPFELSQGVFFLVFPRRSRFTRQQRREVSLIATDCFQRISL